MPALISSSNTTPVFQHPLPLELPPAELSPDVVPPAGTGGVSPRDLNFGLFAAICAPELVDRVIEESGRAEQRCRRLPARLVVYATLFMCVSALAYQKLLNHLVPVASGLCYWQAPNKSSFARARAK